MIDSAARIHTIGRLGKNDGVISEHETRRWNESVRNLELIVERLHADIRRVEKRNLQNRLVYALGLDGIRDRHRELSSAIAAVNVAISAFTAYVARTSRTRF